MRISTAQIYSQALNQMNSSLSDVSELTMMNASQKRINRPSDDPSGMGTVIELTSYDQSLSGYVENCSVVNETLSLADETLMLASENITAAVELMEQASTETYTETQLQMMALELDSYLDSLLVLANTEMGTDSIFAGDDLSSEAYEMGLGITLSNDSLTNADFASMTGEVDSTVKIQFTESGDIGTDELDYRYSTDNGETWTTATLASGDTTIDVGTAQIEFNTGTTVTAVDDEGNGTEFYLREAAHYVGSDTNMSVAISENTSVDMSSVGSTIFGGVNDATNTPYAEPNLFETISNCIVYMEIGDYDSVGASLDDIQAAHDTLETGSANIGARENKVTYTQQSLGVIREITTNSISQEEDADAAQLVVELEQANYVYQAVLSTSAEVMQMSLLNYI
ncbi:flagellar hook-associated protein FlgL [Pseudodesulfovibrio sediminis]|uniref:Flagellar hook-associated protein 3 n=1 Tax=Pseudodesulfovibrio sediminis TaxID=2810563 RepID=A0ABM8HYV6_9BACT|nr:flagellar hook-associated protein FlgL [Pseudodesulfovibrio sediminis]BCS87652.1 hypothetical protein PSDVSF_08940 [Pseudodesulfovibrio sediminis]